jgi:hypothetical protein
MSTRKKQVASHNGHSVVLMDSISYADKADKGVFAVSASHGGKSSAHIALTLPIAGAVFNDAGVGKDAAGVAGLEMLDAKAIPAVTVSHVSARIGDVEDVWEHGVISRVNNSASTGGFVVGGKVRDQVLAWLEKA